MAKIAILYASVGTGHTSAANALRSWWERAYPDTEIFCRDILDYAPAWVRRSVAGSYLAMARRYPWLWQRLYRDTDAPGSNRTLWAGLHGAFSGAYVSRLLADLWTFAPDAVLTTHFMAMSTLAERWESEVPIYFVDTDFGSHAVQRDARFAGWFVASEESARQHRADGLPRADVAVRNFGIPIAPAYADMPSRLDARRSLGIDQDIPTVLVSGGGIGAGPLEKVADSMVDAASWRVEVVCGNNGALYEHLRDKYYPFRHIEVHGFVEEMPEYYAACDVAIIKPGGLSAAEAAAAGAAILLIDPLYGLERYNSDYLLERGAARAVQETRLAGEQVAELLASPEALETLRRQAKSLAKPYAARDIADAVMSEIHKSW